MLDPFNATELQDTPRPFWQRAVLPLLLSIALMMLGVILLPSLPDDLLLNIERVLIIFIGGIFPMTIYRYFVQRRLPTFFREYKQNLRRLGLPENAQQYQDKFNAFFTQGSRKEPIAPFDSPLFIATILSFLGWIFVFFPVSSTLNLSNPNLPIANANPITYGFLGAYIFSVGALVSQYINDDLQPRYYAAMTNRYLMVLSLSWLLRLSETVIPNINPTNILFVAFFIGLFPTVGLRLFQRTVRMALGLVFRGFDEPQPLSDIDGINALVEDRLALEGIENLQNLASANIVDLMLKTRYPVEQIIDWIDQALLQIHARERYEHFRKSGLRTATDFLTAYRGDPTEEPHQWREALAVLLNSHIEKEPPPTEITRSFIRSLSFSLEQDPNLFSIIYWREHEFEALPEDIQAERTKADLKLMQNLPDEAIEAYDALINRFPTYNTLRLYRGLAHASKGDYNSAIEDYDVVIEDTRPNADKESIRQAYLYKGRAHLALADVAEAVRTYKSITQRLQEAYLRNRNISEADEPFELARVFPELQMELAVIQLIYLQEYEQAIVGLTAVIKQNFNRAEALANRGLARYQYHKQAVASGAKPNIEELQYARQDLEKALRLKPSLIPFYINLAHLLHEWQLYTDEEQVLNQALTQLDANPNPDYAYRVRLERGHLYYQLGRYDEAVIDWEVAGNLKPESATSFFFLGTAYRVLAKTQQAIESFQQAIALDKQLLKAKAQLGELLLETMQYEEATTLYVTLLQQAREQKNQAIESQAHFGLGKTYQQAQRGVDAIREFKRAIELAGTNEQMVADATLALGQVALMQGTLETAVTHFSTVAVLYELLDNIRATADAYYHLGYTYEKMGDCETAVENLQIAQQRLNKVFVPSNATDRNLQSSIRRLLDKSQLQMRS